MPANKRQAGSVPTASHLCTKAAERTPRRRAQISAATLKDKSTTPKQSRGMPQLLHANQQDSPHPDSTSNFTTCQALMRTRALDYCYHHGHSNLHRLYQTPSKVLTVYFWKTCLSHGLERRIKSCTTAHHF